MLLRKAVYLLNLPPCRLFLDEHPLCPTSVCHPWPVVDCRLLVKLRGSSHPIRRICPLCDGGISTPALLASALLSGKAGLLDSFCHLTVHNLDFMRKWRGDILVTYSMVRTGIKSFHKPHTEVLQHQKEYISIKNTCGFKRS